MHSLCMHEGKPQCLMLMPEPVDAATIQRMCRHTRHLCVTHVLVLVAFCGYAAQIILGPALEAVGARDRVGLLLRGECHRLVTACFLHASPAHLLRSVFAMLRLLPPAAATFGATATMVSIAIVITNYGTPPHA